MHVRNVLFHTDHINPQEKGAFKSKIHKCVFVCIFDRQCQRRDIANFKKIRKNLKDELGFVCTSTCDLIVVVVAWHLNELGSRVSMPPLEYFSNEPVFSKFTIAAKL